MSGHRRRDGDGVGGVSSRALAGARGEHGRSQGERFWAIPGAREVDLAGARRVADQWPAPAANGVVTARNREGGEREMVVRVVL